MPQKRVKNAFAAFLLQSAFEIFVSKVSDGFDITVQTAEKNVGQLHSVKCVVFYHGIYCHIAEYELVADFERLVKGIIADDIARKAGCCAKTVCERLFIRLSRLSSDGRASREHRAYGRQPMHQG